MELLPHIYITLDFEMSSVAHRLLLVTATSSAEV